MKIENKLPQFDEKKVLLAVTGEQTAKLYLAYQGEINELEYISIPNPVYSDREGFFGKKGMATGSVYEPQKQLKQQIRVSFLHSLREKILLIHSEQKFDSIYLFSPDFMVKEIHAVLSDELRSKIRMDISGNFVEEHPFKLLARVKEELDKIYDPDLMATEEVRKMLNNKDKIDK